MQSGRDEEPSHCSLESRNYVRTEKHGFSNKRRRVFVKSHHVREKCFLLEGGEGTYEDKKGDSLVVKSLSNPGWRPSPKMSQKSLYSNA